MRIGSRKSMLAIVALIMLCMLIGICAPAHNAFHTCPFVDGHNCSICQAINSIRTEHTFAVFMIFLCLALLNNIRIGIEADRNSSFADTLVDRFVQLND